MSYSEVFEILVAAKPLITRLKITSLDYPIGPIEREALEDIKQVLKCIAYNQELLNQAGWTHSDFLHRTQKKGRESEKKVAQW